MPGMQQTVTIGSGAPGAQQQGQQQAQEPQLVGGLASLAAFLPKPAAAPGTQQQPVPGAQPGQQPGTQQQQAQDPYGEHWKSTWADIEKKIGLDTLPADQKVNVGSIGKLLGGAMKEAAALRKQLAEGGGTNADVTKMTAKLQLLEARAELMDNDAFVGEHAGKVTAFKDAAKSLGVDDETASKALAATSLQGIIDAARGIKDEDIRREFIAEAKVAMKATSDFTKSFKSPLDHLETARAKAAEAGSAGAQKSVQANMAAHEAAFNKLLTDPQASSLLASPAFAGDIQALRDELSANKPVSQEAMHQSLIMGRIAPKLLQMLYNVAAQSQQQSGTITRLMGAQPGAQPYAQQQGSGQQQGGGLLSMPVTAGGPLFQQVGARSQA